MHQGTGVGPTGMAGVGQQVLRDQLQEAGHGHVLGLRQVARLTCNTAVRQNNQEEKSNINVI